MTPKRNILIVLLALTVPLVAQVTSYLYVQTDQNGVVQFPTTFWPSNTVGASNALKDSFVPSASAPSLATSPGASRYYGTDGSGAKAWIAFPSVGTGDMLKSTYDADNDGEVDTAEAIAWADITSKPNTFPPESHSHAAGDITSGVLAPARLGSGTANSSTFLRGDNSWQSIPGGVAEAPTDGSLYGRGNSTWTTLGNSATRNVGTSAGQVAAGDDTRFMTGGEKADLLDGGDSGAHYHSADRARANHTGTQARSTISDFSHASTHQSGQADALTGSLDATARVTVRKNSGADIGSRRRVNLSEGSGVTLTIADDPANEEVDVVVSATAGGGTNTATLDQSNAFTGATNSFQTIRAQEIDLLGGPLGLTEGGTAATSAGQARTNLGLGIGSNVQAYDADLDDLADGSLTGSKVGTGIAAGNITTGTIGTARLGSGTASSSTYLRGDQTWQTISGGSLISSNGGNTAGMPVVIMPDGSYGTTNVSTVATQNVSTLVLSTPLGITSGGHGATTAAGARTNLGVVIGTDVQAYDADLADLADGTLTGSKIGTGIDAANITAGTLDNARLDADLQDLADGTLSGSKIGTGVDGDAVTVNTVGTGRLVRESAAGGSFSWDIDAGTETADGNTTPFVTIPVLNGNTKQVDLTVTAGGPSSYSGGWKLSGILANYNGSTWGSTSQRWTNYSAPGMDASLAVTGTNLVLSVRGPTNSAQNVKWIVRGSVFNTTNAVTASSGLDTNGLVAVWNLDETSGNRTSSDGYALVLTQTNSVGSTSGVKNNAARFSRASSQSFGMATTNLIEARTNLNFAMTAWVNPSSFPSSGQIYGIVGKTDPGVNGRVEYGLNLRYYGANEFEFYFLTGTNGAGAGTHTIASTTRGTSTNAWYFVAAGRDANVSSNWISVNGSSKEWVASPGPGPTATDFRVGLYGSATHFMNGLIDQITFWNTNLNDARIIALSTNPPPNLP